MIRMGGSTMRNIIRVTGISVENLKNIKYGSLKMNSTFSLLGDADVIGVYGQNGSGKTAVIEAFKILKVLLSGDDRQLPKRTDHLLYYGESEIKLNFEFIIQNENGEYFVTYNVVLEEGLERLSVKEESIEYRENMKQKRFKSLINKKNNEIWIRNLKVQSLEDELRIATMVAHKMAIKNSTTFVFRDELRDVYENYLNEEEFEVIKNLKFDFDRDFHVIDAINYGYLIANIMMPLSIHLENVRGELPYHMSETMVLPIEMFTTIKGVIEQTNIVLQHIIPGLTIEVAEIHEQTMENGEKGVKFEFLSNKESVKLPLRSESAGTLKIISILSTLIAVYNNPNAFVVIDELDAGVFEYLLGELLDVISINGKGQLFFTSHNLRVLELLPKENLWFTTTNEKNRFIRLKGIKKLSNARDIYLRAVQLGGQEESIYVETDSFDIKRSFRKAGNLNE